MSLYSFLQKLLTKTIKNIFTEYQTKIVITSLLLKPTLPAAILNLIVTKSDCNNFAKVFRIFGGTKI